MGLLDLLAGINLILLRFGLAESTAWFFVVYLIIKSLPFLPDITSFIDIIAAIFIIMAIFGIFQALTWIMVIWLLQKSILSLFIKSKNSK